ncbi:cytochrome c1 [Shewanella sp. A32]|uniref:cytochrome c1 n=1 Tax=Shewanella sp. A32 TaxID=3031327 RepID=UPI0023B9E2BB|nr:cytochrome c1 [Shewanella sp. A32]MDF0535809.1 cytochrome c1 [Shewanella sp. A32]
MRAILLAFLILLPTCVWATDGIPPLPIDLGSRDVSSLQRGFKAFQQYCSGCHSTHYQRYNQVANDLQLSDAQMSDAILTDAKPFELMENAMSKKDAARWFGVAPPDLTLVVRVRGEAWVYRFLQGFYRDPQRPFGVNNLQYPYVAMPHVLQDLQGLAEPILETETINGKARQQVVGVSSPTGGQLSATEYDRLVTDLINYLAYSAEPMKTQRQQIGIWVLGFLVIFLFLAWLLKKEYWKDVH